MTFYNGKISKNKNLMKAWRAGHQMKLDDEDICVPEICGEIENWMRRHRHPRSRLSLRSFSVLLSGTIRLYRDEVNKLLRDTFNYSCVKTPTAPRPILRTVDQGMLPQGTMFPDSSEDSEEESFVLMPPIIESSTAVNASRTKQCSSIDDAAIPASSADCQHCDIIDLSSEESTVYTVLPDDKQPEKCPNLNTQERKTQAVQTEDNSIDDNRQGFHTNNPFGYILVHDNYNSRIPSKIIFTSLNNSIF